MKDYTSLSQDYFFLALWIAGLLLLGIYVFIRMHGRSILRSTIRSYLQEQENEFESLIPISLFQFHMLPDQKVRHISGAFLCFRADGMSVYLHTPKGEVLEKRLVAKEDFIQEFLYHRNSARLLNHTFSDLSGTSWELSVQLESQGKALVAVIPKQVLSQ